MSDFDVLPVVGARTTEGTGNIAKDALKGPVLLASGRTVTLQRWFVEHNGDRVEVLSSTAWCYKQVKEAYLASVEDAPKSATIAKKKRVPAKKATQEVTSDDPDGGSGVAGRPDGRPEDADPA